MYFNLDPYFQKHAKSWKWFFVQLREKEFLSLNHWFFGSIATCQKIALL